MGIYVEKKRDNCVIDAEVKLNKVAGVHNVSLTLLQAGVRTNVATRGVDSTRKLEITPGSFFYIPYLRYIYFKPPCKVSAL